jgi:hypothetical protein
MCIYTYAMAIVKSICSGLHVQHVHCYIYDLNHSLVNAKFLFAMPPHMHMYHTRACAYHIQYLVSVLISNAGYY